MNRDELVVRLAEHDKWLTDPAVGRQLDLAGVTLVQENLSGWRFRRARFADVSFESVDLSDSWFLECEFDGVEFKRSVVDRADFTDSRFTRLSFEQSSVLDSSLAYTKGSGMRIESSSLDRSNFTKSFWQGLDAPGISCQGCNFRRMTLEDANLVGARLLDAKLVAVSLTNVDLRGALLQGSTWTRAHLMRVRLGGATGQASDTERLVAEDVELGEDSAPLPLQPSSDDVARALASGVFR